MNCLTWYDENCASLATLQVVGLSLLSMVNVIISLSEVERFGVLFFFILGSNHVQTIFISLLSTNECLEPKSKIEESNTKDQP